jgi:hypothetical protein
MLLKPIQLLSEIFLNLPIVNEIQLKMYFGFQVLQFIIILKLVNELLWLTISIAPSPREETTNAQATVLTDIVKLIDAFTSLRNMSKNKMNTDIDSW